jgi:thiamine biosynthesis lipoprotein
MHELHRFRAMGCDVVVGGASPRERRAVERLFAERERRFSRFVGASELNMVNSCSGRVVRLSTAFAEMLELALLAARETEGLVDPTLGAAIVAAGYDRDFELLRDEGSPRPAACSCWPSLRLVGPQLFVPAGVLLDLNGVVKGRTVDDALALLDGDAFVSAGGDLAARGAIDVGLPGGGAVKLVQGGLATSGTDRRWRRGGRVQHHLIDPRTGSPSDAPWRQVTVCASSCVGADVAAKAAFLRGYDGPAWLEAHGLPGRFVHDAGGVVLTRGWPAAPVGAATCT